jgi:hypothetical protein
LESKNFTTSPASLGDKSAHTLCLEAWTLLASGACDEPRKGTLTLGANGAAAKNKNNRNAAKADTDTQDLLRDAITI